MEPNKLKTLKIDQNDNIEYNTIIIQLFEKLVDLLKKANKLETDKKQKTINNFRIRNLDNALLVLSGLDYEITLDNVNDIKLPGIGKGTISRIVEILENDNLEEIDELEKITKTKILKIKLTIKTSFIFIKSNF